MSTDNRQADYLGLMLQATAQARSYVHGLDRELFLADRKTQDAVIMKLLVIGELAAQMLERHPDFAAEHPAIPWKQMKGMRNRMAHGYFELDMDVVWETVRVALPELESSLQDAVR